MATVQQVYEHIHRFAPFGIEEPWDNCGLLVGDPHQQVEKILVALDVTDSVLQEAQERGANLIVTHHPVIFTPLKRVTCDQSVYQIIRRGLSVISAHTNLDKAPQGVNYHLARTLGLEDVRHFGPVVETEVGKASLGRMGDTAQPTTVAQLAQLAKERLGCGGVQYVESAQPVRTVAVVGGSGGDFLEQARQLGAQCLVTADVKHDQFLQAAHMGMGLVDAGHFSTEQVVCAPLARWIQELVPQTWVARCSGEPFHWAK